MIKGNKKKNNLDEMQEQKLLRIEHNGMWLAFWGLLIAIFVQDALYMGQENMSQALAGEWIIFMCLALYLCFACIRNGIWDRRLKPNRSTNSIVSLIASVACGVFFFFISYFRYKHLMGSIATGLIIFASVFVLCFVALEITTFLYKKRVAHLEAENDSSKNE